MDAGDQDYKSALTAATRQTIEANTPNIFVPGLGMVNRAQMIKIMEMQGKNTPALYKKWATLAIAAAERGEEFPEWDVWQRDFDTTNKRADWVMAGSPGTYEGWLEKMKGGINIVDPFGRTMQTVLGGKAGQLSTGDFNELFKDDSEIKKLEQDVIGRKLEPLSKEDAKDKAKVIAYNENMDYYKEAEIALYNNKLTKLNSMVYGAYDARGIPTIAKADGWYRVDNGVKVAPFPPR